MDQYKAITVEETLEKLGGFSWFQIWAIFVILMGEIPCSMIAIMPVFTGTSNVPFECQERINKNYYGRKELVFGQDPGICGRNCTPGLVEDEPLASVVQEWLLVCDRAWISDLFTSIQMVGMTIGALSASQLADAYGRKKGFYLTTSTMSLFTLASGLVQDVYSFGITRFLVGVSLGGFNVVYFIFLMEFMTPRWRTVAACLTLWSVGIMSLALLAWLLPPWRYLTWSAAAVALVVTCLFPTVPETPRWLLCKERTEEAGKCFDRIAKMNGRTPITPQELQVLQKSVLLEKESKDGLNSTGQSTWELYRNPKLRYRLFLLAFGWFTVALTYYSFSFNTKNLGGSPHLNVLYMGLVDLPAFPSGILFNNWLGRRKTYAGFLLFAAIFLVAIVGINWSVGLEGNEDLVSVLCYLGRFGVAAAWAIVSCFTAESFPTVCRSTALGVCAFFSYVGGVAAPQIVYLGTIYASAPYFIFSGLVLISAASPWLIPETNEKPLQNFVSSS